MRSFNQTLFGDGAQKGVLERSGVRSMIVLVVMIIAGAVKDHKPVMPELIANAEVLAVGFLAAFGLTTTASYKVQSAVDTPVEVNSAPVDAAPPAPHA